MDAKVPTTECRSGLQRADYIVPEKCLSDIGTLVTLQGWGSTFLNGTEFPYRSSTGLGR